MAGPKGAVLADRGVVRVAGEDAGTFLQGLVTADVATLGEGQASLAALLSPQGKILFDFLLVRAGGEYFLDCRADMAAGLARRLGFYRLRARVEVEDLSASRCVIALWGGEPKEAPALCFADPRLAALGRRAIVATAAAAAALAAAGAEPADAAAWHAHRIVHAVPEATLDFAYGETFPHEADMDRLGGVSFTKGCYVGQEVVSRMEHRASARTRIVPVVIDGAAAPGSEVRAGGKSIGTLGSVAGRRGLVMLRLDRTEEARAAGAAITAGAARLAPHDPAWADFGLGGRPDAGAS